MDRDPRDPSSGPDAGTARLETPRPETTRTDSEAPRPGEQERMDELADACATDQADDQDCYSAATGRRLEPRQARVLWELSRLGDATVAFSGVRRRLDLHPQALTRTLDRLVDAGLADRAADDEGSDGYRLTEEGFRSVACCAGEAGPRTTPLVCAVVPAHLDADDVADRLAGRWFQGLHWYGQAEGPGETTLAWLTDPDARMVRLRLVGGMLTVEAETDDGTNVTSELDLDDGADEGTGSASPSADRGDLARVPRAPDGNGGGNAGGHAGGNGGGDGSGNGGGNGSGNGTGADGLPLDRDPVLAGVRALLGAVAELYEPPTRADDAVRAAGAETPDRDGRPAA